MGQSKKGMGVVKGGGVGGLMWEWREEQLKQINVNKGQMDNRRGQE